MSGQYSEAAYDAQAVEFQSRADTAYRHHGLRAPARVHGEPTYDYRRRLLKPLAPHSESWAKINVWNLPESALPAVEQQIFADAIRAATRSGPGTGPLREVTETDRSGRTISRFYGDPEACWAPFKQDTRRLVGINKL